MSPKEKPPYTESQLEHVLSANFSNYDVRYILRKYRLQIIPKSRMKQSIAIFKIIKDSNVIKTTESKIASIFEVDRGNFCRALNKNPKTSNGRPTLLSPEYEEELLLYIYLRAECHKPCTKKDIRNYIWEQFKITVSPTWYNNFIKRHQNKIAKTIAYPQEKDRIKLPANSCFKHISNLKKYVAGLPTELVFNLDEVGQQEWANKKTKKVVVPSFLKNARIEYCVERAEKKISLITTISMAGDVLTPLMITSRKTLDEEVMQSGIRIGEDIIIRYQESAYASMEIISEYINDVFLVYIQNLRNEEKFKDKPAVLICDNCAAHFDNAMIKKLTQNNVRLITIPPHSSHLFQPLDLVTFGVFKNEIRSTTSKYENGTQLDRIARVLSAIERATTSENNRNAFYRAGLEIDTSTDPHIVIINENKLKQRIAENCLVDSPTPPKSKPFGYINKK